MADTVLSVLSGSWLQILSTMLVAYLLGSISFSIIITKKVAHFADIRVLGHLFCNNDGKADASKQISDKHC